jgi:hypothetical protein
MGPPKRQKQIVQSSRANVQSKPCSLVSRAPAPYHAEGLVNPKVRALKNVTDLFKNEILKKNRKVIFLSIFANFSHIL